MNPKYQQNDLLSVWDAAAKNYDFQNYWNGIENQANLHHLIQNIGDPSGKKIIEIGCGSGFTSAVLSQKGAICALLDISAEALRVASTAFQALELPEPDCFCENALESSLPADSYDIVWNGGVIEHFYDEGKKLLIAEMVRLARPGGKVIIMVPNRNCRQFQLMQRWQKFRGTWAYGFEDDLSPEQLEMLCDSLKIKAKTTYAFNPILGWRWVPIIKKLLKPLCLETFELHCRRSISGFVSVLVIHKDRDIAS
jgi:2-polyprenyl-3-methyl-5-hydroxy-6-metoxy-1,4-benzoquinol methylase